MMKMGWNRGRCCLQISRLLFMGWIFRIGYMDRFQELTIESDGWTCFALNRVGLLTLHNVLVSYAVYKPCLSQRLIGVISG